MSVINAILRPTFDALLFPFRELPALVGLLVISVVCSIFVLLVYKRTSNQPAIAAIKDQIAASFFEIRLFNDDLRAILRAQLDLLRNNLTYLRLNLVPLFWMIAPFILLIAQLQFHYGYDGLEPDSPTVLTVELAADGDDAAPRPELELDLPPGVRAESPGVWIPSRSEMAWRIAVDEPGSYELGVRLDGDNYTKTLDATRRVERRSPERLARGFVNQLLYPAEPPLPAGAPLRAIRIVYPDATILGMWWMILFFILTIVIAYALRKPFGVTF